MSAPLFNGAANETFKDPVPTVATVGLAGFLGAPTTIATVLDEGELVPPTFRAATVN